jgi:hypothetical protein
MDANGFDALARAVAAPTDRRGLLKATAVGGLGLLGLAAAGEGALAAQNTECTQCRRQCHRNNKKPGKKDPTNCNSKCRNQCNRQCTNDGDCGTNQRCQGGTCKKR